MKLAPNLFQKDSTILDQNLIELELEIEIENKIVENQRWCLAPSRFTYFIHKISPTLLLETKYSL